MSYKRSVFPEGGYDTFIELYDLPPSYEPLVSEFAQLRANQNKTSEEEARFNELTTMLQNYILTAEKWNKFCDAVTGLQKFFLENTQGYIDGLKTETRQTVDSGKAEINTTKDNALITIENKKDNIIAYMDETTAGAIRNDIGVMGDSTVEGRSLVDKTNLLKTQVDTNVQNITDNSNKINNLSTDVDSHKAEKATQDGYGHIRLKDIPNPEVATKAEAEAGTNNTKFMTPLRTSEALDSRIKFFDDGTIGGKQVNLLVNGKWMLFQEVVNVSDLSWAEVQQLVREGKASKYFSVGDQLVSLYDGKEIIWEVIGIDVDTPADSNFTHSMTIQTKDCLHSIQFDAREPNNPDSNRKTYGNNRYIHSAVRQWLNSNESKFQWKSQHQYDAKPTDSLDLYDGAGFLYRLDPELVAVLGTVNKKVAKAKVDGGGQDTFSDKVFLLSRVEVGLGEEGDVAGEFVYPFYDGITDAGRIKQLNGRNRAWWLRSPFVSYSYDVRTVSTSGEVYRNYAYMALELSPACVII